MVAGSTGSYILKEDILLTAGYCWGSSKREAPTFSDKGRGFSRTNEEENRNVQSDRSQTPPTSLVLSAQASRRRSGLIVTGFVSASLTDYR